MVDHDFKEAVNKFRAGFPALREWTYMDLAARGILSNHVREAIDRHLDDAQWNGATKDVWFETVERARERFATIINASPNEIAYVKNVSEGINVLAHSVPWEPGDNVVLCPELEHPNNVYPWLHVQERGLKVRAFPARDGEINVDEVISQIDDRTRILSVSSVTFAPGHRTKLDHLGRECRKRGVFFLVDAAQSVGVLHTDVAESYIDGLVTSTQKGLLALYGMGYLYCREEWLSVLQPPFLARFSVDLDDAHEAEMGTHNYVLHASARKFEIGNYNYAGAVAVDASLESLHALGTAKIDHYVSRLASSLSERLAGLDLPVLVPRDRERSNIVTVGTLAADSTPTDCNSDVAIRLYEHLRDNNVKLSWRRGLLRFSLHAYNTQDDVDYVAELASQVGRD